MTHKGSGPRSSMGLPPWLAPDLSGGRLLGTALCGVFFAPSDSPPRPRGHLKKLHLEMGGVFLPPPIPNRRSSLSCPWRVTTPTYSRQAGAEHFQQRAEFLPLRNRALGPLAVAVCPFRSPGGPALPLAPPCNRQRPFFVAVDRHGFPLLVRAPHLRGVAGLTDSFFSWSVATAA